MIIFRGFANNQWFYGGYLEHDKVQPSIGFSDEDYTNNIQHIIIFDGFADWNMPKSIKCAEVDKLSVGISYDDFDNSKKRIFSDDILSFNEDIGLVISSKKGLLVIDSKNECFPLSDILKNNVVQVINNVFEAKEYTKVEKKLIEFKSHYDTTL